MINAFTRSKPHPEPLRNARTSCTRQGRDTTAAAAPERIACSVRDVRGEVGLQSCNITVT
eukprot:6194912-Pleurochrysis_carterae.AAC.1